MVEMKEHDIALPEREVSMETLCAADDELGRCDLIVVTKNGVYRSFTRSGLYGYMEYYEAAEPITDLTLQAPIAVRSAVRNRVNYSDVMVLAGRIGSADDAEQGKTDGLYCYAYNVEQGRAVYEFVPGTTYPLHDAYRNSSEPCIVGLCNDLWAARGTGKQICGGLICEVE